jgi:hypothetical protein
MCIHVKIYRRLAEALLFPIIRYRIILKVIYSGSTDAALKKQKRQLQLISHP